MEEKGPVGLLPLGHQEKGRQELDGQKKNQQKARDAMEDPDKHVALPFSCDGLARRSTRATWLLL
jgi:hypothetical protein